MSKQAATKKKKAAKVTAKVTKKGVTNPQSSPRHPKRSVLSVEERELRKRVLAIARQLGPMLLDLFKAFNLDLLNLTDRVEACNIIRDSLIGVFLSAHPRARIEGKDEFERAIPLVFAKEDVESSMLWLLLRLRGAEFADAFSESGAKKLTRIADGMVSALVKWTHRDINITFIRKCREAAEAQKRGDRANARPVDTPTAIHKKAPKRR